MKSILNFILPVLCSFIFIACNNQPSATAGDTPAEVANEPTITVEDEDMEGDEEWEISIHKASELKASELAGKLEALTFYDQPQQSEEETDDPGRFEVVTQLYPLGWSKDGNFAYAEYSKTYHEEHVLVHTIKNMHSGDTLWQQEMVYGIAEEGSDELEYAETEQVIIVNGDESEADLFNYVWAASEAPLAKALKNTGITVNPSGKFLKQTNYNTISFETEEVKTEDEDNPMQYLLKSNRHDPVLIRQDYFPANETKVAGLIKSPYSETIAVICMQNRQFFEMTDEVVPILVGYKVD